MYRYSVYTNKAVRLTAAVWALQVKYQVDEWIQDATVVNDGSGADGARDDRWQMTMRYKQNSWWLFSGDRNLEFECLGRKKSLWSYYTSFTFGEFTEASSRSSTWSVRSIFTLEISRLKGKWKSSTIPPVPPVLRSSWLIFLLFYSSGLNWGVPRTDVSPRHVSSESKGVTGLARRLGLWLPDGLQTKIYFRTTHQSHIDVHVSV